MRTFFSTPDDPAVRGIRGSLCDSCSLWSFNFILGRTIVSAFMPSLWIAERMDDPRSSSVRPIGALHHQYKCINVHLCVSKLHVLKLQLIFLVLIRVALARPLRSGALCLWKFRRFSKRVREDQSTSQNSVRLEETRIRHLFASLGGQRAISQRHGGTYCPATKLAKGRARIKTHPVSTFRRQLLD